MSENDQLRKDVAEIRKMLQELIETLHGQAKALDKFALQLEQQTDLRDFPKEFAVATSKLGELKYRAGKLAPTEAAE